MARRAWPAVCFCVAVAFEINLKLTCAALGTTASSTAATLAVASGYDAQWPCVMEAHDKCVFIISTGRSGSTALLDAVNQLPGVFVSGENAALFQQVESLANLAASLNGPLSEGNDRALHDPETVKEWYHKSVQANKHKPAWYNHLPVGVPRCMAQAIFRQMYGFGSLSEYTVGFKEIRYSPIFGQVLSYDKQQPWLPPHTDKIDSFGAFAARMEFLKGLCKQPKIVLNARRNVSGTAHSDFYAINGGAAQSYTSLQQATEFVQRYHEQQPNTTMLVWYEEMYDSPSNATLARQLARFLGAREDDVSISFSRVPRY